MSIVLPRLLQACALFLSLVGPTSVYAGGTDLDVPCGPIAAMKDADKYRPLSHDELTAARVLFYMAPDTPASLPPGDAAMMLEREDGSASVVFIDRGEACAPIRILKDGMAMFKQIRDGVVTHAAGGL